MTDTALQRKNMVESQVRPSDVTDRRITSAMQALAREDFVPDALRAVAYMDDPLTVAPGRSLLAPRTSARLLQLANIEPDDKILVVGALFGYTAAVAAGLASKVVALEQDAALAEKAKGALSNAGISNVTVVCGPLTDGWSGEAPYDAIVIEGAFEQLPPQLLSQLRADGHLVGIDNASGVGRAVCIQVLGGKDQQSISRRVAFEASAPCLPGFERTKTFTF